MAAVVARAGTIVPMPEFVCRNQTRDADPSEGVVPRLLIRVPIPPRPQIGQSGNCGWDTRQSGLPLRPQTFCGDARLSSTWKAAVDCRRTRQAPQPHGLPTAALLTQRVASAGPQILAPAKDGSSYGVSSAVLRINWLNRVGYILAVAVRLKDRCALRFHKESQCHSVGIVAGWLPRQCQARSGAG
jgi:hypothetical protein